MMNTLYPIKQVTRRGGLTVMMLMAFALLTQAQDFDKWFADNTLRIDYMMCGDAHKQDIFLHGLYTQERWAGRKGRLTEAPLKGNGQLTVRDHATGDTIYVWTFSTLFQEWLMDNEAKTLRRSFEASYNIPYPKNKVDVTITLTDKHQQVTAQMTHTIDPTDILIRPLKENDIPYRYLWKGGRANGNSLTDVDLTGCVDLAIVAEGYTVEQMDKFYADSQRAVDALFEREPFASLKSRFNVVAVASPSQNSGPSVPHLGQWNNTAVRTHYDTFYSDRYLMTESMHHLYNLLCGVPFEHVLILVNTDTYGGGGIYNQLLTCASDHATFKQVFVHEFGHSYAGLADEYAYDDMDTEWYPADCEPWEPNITTLHDFASKWADMMPAQTPIPTPLDPNVPNFRKLKPDDAEGFARLNACVSRVGVFEGAGYQSHGCYRPAQECRMKVNEVLDFCPVCSRAITRITEFYTSPQHAVVP